MEKIKIGITGYGYWGINLVRNFNLLNNVEIIICEKDQDKIKKAKKLYPDMLVTDNYEKMLQEEKIKAIVLATPVKTHFPLAKQALEAGKHVLIEKPMTSSVEEAEELIKIAKEKNVVLMVDHTFLFTAAVQKIKDIIESGDIGELHYFDSERMNLGLLQEDSNVVWDLAPHDISIIDYLFDDEIESVFATGSKHVNDKYEELVHITIKYKTGLVGHLHVSWLSPVKSRRILIGGSKKMIQYDDVEPSEKIKIYDKGVDMEKEAKKATPFSPIYRAGDILIPKLGNGEALYNMAAHFIECIELGKQSDIAGGEKGLTVVKVIIAANESIEKGRIINVTKD